MTNWLPKLPNTLLWGLKIMVALAFFAAGTAKLLGASMMVATFEGIRHRDAAPQPRAANIFAQPFKSIS